LRLLFDAMMSPQLAIELRSLGHDALHVADLDLHHAPDTEILDRAASEGRVVVTADLDFPRLLALSESAQAAVILFRGGDFDTAWARQRLQQVLSSVPENELAASLVVVERERIRRRRLPI
jgi:predicted nuclease of predicted toxin-antitoxin system